MHIGLSQNKPGTPKVSPNISFPAHNLKICWDTHGSITLKMESITI